MSASLATIAFTASARRTSSGRSPAESTSAARARAGFPSSTSSQTTAVPGAELRGSPVLELGRPAEEGAARLREPRLRELREGARAVEVLVARLETERDQALLARVEVGGGGDRPRELGERGTELVREAPAVE